MTARFLLDTNIVSDVINNGDPGRVAQKVAAIGEDRVATSIFVAAELRFGALKKGAPRLIERVEAALDRLNVIPWETPADVIYAEIRTALERAGTPIGATNMLIAAQTRALGLTLVTNNEREFNRVSGLSIENWLK